MSWAILGEVPGWVTLAGGVLCLAGVAVARGRTRERPGIQPTEVGSAASR
jgi:drug/metabolite transporter (DMT)-like permease